MASLQGTKIKNTFKSLLKVADNGEIEVTSQEITDGLGTGTGVSLNTQGDVIATGTVSFDSLKDTDENITVTKFVDEADGIAANDNDTSIPTSAAVKDYVDTSASGLQSQINTNDTDITALQAADTTLQNNINSEESARIAADSTLQSNINAEESARISADSGLQTQINNNDSDITALQTADTTLQNNINAEESARIAADNTLQSNITAEATTRGNADTALQTNINNEEAARIAADTTLQNNINTEANTRASADTSLQNQITANDGDISALDGRLTTAEGNITSNDTDISNLDSRLTTAEGNITSNDTDISNLQSGKQDISEKNQANGYAPLDAGAKVPIANIPDSVLGQVEYQGTYNASTDTPTLPAASTVKGDYYVVSVAGTYETISYAIGDWIISNGTAWEKVDNTDAVTTVFGRLGAVVANEADYDSFYPLISDLNTTNNNVSGLDSRLTTAEGDITAIENKTDFITVTQAVNLDTIESDTATNNAKISFDSTSSSKLAGIEENADVTDATNVASAGAMMTGVAVLNDLSDVSGTPSDGQVLTYDTVNGWQPETAASAPVTSVNSETGAVVLDADDISDATTTNKFTTQTDIDKLAGIETGAEVNTVDSVNTQTGAVVLDADDIDDSTTTNKFTSQTDIDKLAGIESGAEVNTVDSVNGETGVVVLDADDIDDTTTTHKFTTQTDIDKLAGIEASADVTDATNVAAAGAVMTDTAGSLSSLAVSGDVSIADKIIHTGDTNTAIRFPSADTVTIETGGSERLRVDSIGNVGIGTTNIPNNLNGCVSNVGEYHFTSDGRNIRWNSYYESPDAQPSYYQNGYGFLMGLTGDGDFVFINAPNNTSGADAAQSVTERMRITSAGGVGINSNNPGQVLNVRSSANFSGNAGLARFDDSLDRIGIYTFHSNATFSSSQQLFFTTRSQNSAFNFVSMASSGGIDNEFKFRGDGQAYADGAWNGGGADYAEYFESLLGNAIGRGISVIMEGDKVRPATDSDDASKIIGIVRPKGDGIISSAIGNAAWDRWNKKYLTDDFGEYIREEHNVIEWTEIIIDEQGNEEEKNHSYESNNIPDDVIVPDDAIIKTQDDKGNKFTHRKLNPDYDETFEYIPREQRDEWLIVGLLGQVPMLKGQPVNPNWIKMKDVSETVELWFIK